MAPSDEELVAQCLNGEQDAFAALVRRYERQVCVLALSRLHNPEDAKDVVQETFERAYTHLRELKRGDRFVFWISRIALHTAETFRRRRKEIPTDMNEAMKDTPNPRSEYEELERRADFKRLFEEVWRLLTEEERAVFLMRVVGGLSVAETAEALIISPRAVEKRCERARDKVQQRFAHLGRLEEVTELVRSYGLTVAVGAEFIAQMLKSAQPMSSQPSSPSAFRWFGYWTTGSVTVAGAVMGWATWGSLKSNVEAIPIEKSPIEVRMMPPPKLRLVLAENFDNLKVGQAVPGWQAMIPSRDATAPIVRKDSKQGKVMLVSNDFDVYRKVGPLSGEVVLELSMKPRKGKDTNFSVAFNFDAPKPVAPWMKAMFFGKNDSDRWFYSNPNAPEEAQQMFFRPVDEHWHHVRVVYRMVTACYDLSFDGEHVCTNVALSPLFRGKPVMGINLQSGRGEVGTPSDFDDLKVYTRS